MPLRRFFEPYHGKLRNRDNSNEQRMSLVTRKPAALDHGIADPCGAVLSGLRVLSQIQPEAPGWGRRLRPVKLDPACLRPVRAPLVEVG